MTKKILWDGSLVDSKDDIGITVLYKKTYNWQKWTLLDKHAHMCLIERKRKFLWPLRIWTHKNDIIFQQEPITEDDK